MEHPQDRFVRAAVQRTIQRSRRRGDRRERIREGTADAPHRERGAVLLVIGVQDEENVECVLEHLVGREGLARCGLEHVQEVAGEAQAFGRWHDRFALSSTRRVRGERRRLRDDAGDLTRTHRLVVHVLGFRIERPQRAEGRNQCAHRVRILGHRIEQPGDPRRGDPVVVDRAGPRVELRGRWQFAVQQQIRGFQVRALLRQLFDGIAAIPQNALVAVDVADAAAAGGGVDEGRIVGDQAEILGTGPDLAQVGGANRTVVDRDLGGAAGAVVGQRQRVRHRVEGARRESGLGWWFVSVVGVGGNRLARDAVVAIHPPRQIQQFAPFAAERAPRGVDGLLAAVCTHRSGDGRHLNIL